jgi:hypothetical protein
MNKVYFEESQKFRQWWLWLLLGSVLLMFVGSAFAAVYVQLITGRPFGNNPMSDTGVIIFFISSIVFSLVMVFLQLSFHLETKVDRFGISYRFFPLIRQWRTIYREQIQSWEITRKCVFHYGIHYGIKSKTLNVQGNTQLALKLPSGRKINLGTQHPDELSQAMQKLLDRQPDI